VTASVTTPPALLPTGAIPPRIRRKNRPMLLGIAVAIVALGVAIVAWAIQDTSARPYIAVVHEVPYGQQITAADLQSVSIRPVAGLVPIPTGSANTVVGKYAQVPLKAGTLLTPTEIGGPVAPAAGQTVVGLKLDDDQRPQRSLAPGDHVVLVVTTDGGSGSDPSATSATSATPETIPATVLDVSAPDVNGSVIIDVVVPDATGPTLADTAKAGGVSVILAAGTSGS